MKKNILIVDDGLLNRQLIKKHLSDLEVNIYEAENGLEAINLIKSKKVDLVFMDIEMPVMDGIDAIRIIRKEMPTVNNKIPVIAVTALDINHLKDYGFSKRISKPVTMRKIQPILDSLRIEHIA